jgi:tRNA(Arg) A34 adenosine deaminase TadA
LKSLPVKVDKDLQKIALTEFRHSLNRLEILCLAMFAAKLPSSERNHLYVRFTSSAQVPDDILRCAKHYARTLTEMLQINKEFLPADDPTKNIVAILVKNNSVVGYGVKDQSNPNKHAEIALLWGQDFGLQDGKKHILICSLQPCRMCFGAISFRQIRYCFYLEAEDNPLDIFSCDTNFPQLTFGGLLERPDIERELNLDDQKILETFKTFAQEQHNQPSESCNIL